MKIATNVQRDVYGGIAISNLALFDWLIHTDDTVVGIETVTARKIMGPIIFRHYLPSFFSHHIINARDIIPVYPWDKRYNLRKKWKPLIDAVKSVLLIESPDVVLVNGTYSTPWILTQAAVELGIPIVLRYAGVLQREIGKRDYFVRKRMLKYERFVANSAHTIIFPSNVCKRVVEDEILNRKITNSFVIPNSAKKRPFRKRKISHRYTIASIGRWAAIKNFKAFVDAHEVLSSREWQHRAILVTPGKNKSSSIPETIERKPSMSHDDLLVFYRSVDLLIVPSLFETFSNVAAEAVLSGTSVLVSKNVGFSEILIKAGLKRMVIDSFEDSEVVANHIEKISKKRLTAAEVSRVAKLLDPKRLFDEMIEVIEKTANIHV